MRLCTGQDSKLLAEFFGANAVVNCGGSAWFTAGPTEEVV
jgi:hypothetical protein